MSVRGRDPDKALSARSRRSAEGDNKIEGSMRQLFTSRSSAASERHARQTYVDTENLSKYLEEDPNDCFQMIRNSLWMFTHSTER